MSKSSVFLKEAEVKSFDLKHRKTIHFNISRYDEAVNRGKQQYKLLEDAKELASGVKQNVVDNLGEYLVEFEKNFSLRGGKVFWASTSSEAMNYILELLKNKAVKNVVKSKSMTTEEVEFNELLEKSSIESLETDLGEFIVQIAGEKPYHIITPAMHKSKEDISELFHKLYKTPENSSPEQITAFVRELLRKKFVGADAGITGANFLIADTGSICLTENEGNAYLTTAFPKLHIVLVGMEKILPSYKYLSLFWPLLATHGTGQKMTVYNHLISGPRQPDETDGPEEMHVVILDNKRSEIYSNVDIKPSLKCIRCGACLNACPVYRNIGGYTYSTTYSGPIGSVISPHLRGLKEYKHLSFASTLCGKCTEVCPVKIDLHRLLLYNRSQSVQAGYSKMAEKGFIKVFRTMMLHRSILNIAPAGIKNGLFKIVGPKLWGPRRSLPVFKTSFNKSYRK